MTTSKQYEICMVFCVIYVQFSAFFIVYQILVFLNKLFLGYIFHSLCWLSLNFPLRTLAQRQSYDTAFSWPPLYLPVNQWAKIELPVLCFIWRLYEWNRIMQGTSNDTSNEISRLWVWPKGHTHLRSLEITNSFLLITCDPNQMRRGISVNRFASSRRLALGVKASIDWCIIWPTRVTMWPWPTLTWGQTFILTFQGHIICGSTRLDKTSTIGSKSFYLYKRRRYRRKTTLVKKWHFDLWTLVTSILT